MAAPVVGARSASACSTGGPVARIGSEGAQAAIRALFDHADRVVPQGLLRWDIAAHGGQSQQQENRHGAPKAIFTAQPRQRCSRGCSLVPRSAAAARAMPTTPTANKNCRSMRPPPRVARSPLMMPVLRGITRFWLCRATPAFPLSSGAHRPLRRWVVGPRIHDRAVPWKTVACAARPGGGY